MRGGITLGMRDRSVSEVSFRHIYWSPASLVPTRRFGGGTLIH